MMPAMSGRTASQPADLLEAAQHGIVIEGTALNHNTLAEIAGIGDLDYLEQRILDDGVGQSGGNIGNLGAFLLSLFNVASS